MSNQNAPRKKFSAGAKTGAGAAGAGSGTLIVLLANNLPNTDPRKSWLILLAPSVSIGISVVYAWIRTGIEEYFEERKIKKFVEQAKATLREALENKNTSEEHRSKLRGQLEELELLLVKSSIEKVRVVDSLKPFPEANA